MPGGIAAGLGDGYRNLLQDNNTEEQTRALRLSNDATQALQPGAIENMKAAQMREKALDTPHPLNDIIGAHPMLRDMYDDYSQKMGWPKNKDSITPREMQAGQQHYKDNPDEMLKVTTGFKGKLTPQITEIDAAMKSYQEELKDLTMDAGDSVRNKSKIDKVNEKLQELQKQKEPLAKSWTEATTEITRLEDQMMFTKIGKMTDTQLASLDAITKDPKVKKIVSKIIDTKKESSEQRQFESEKGWSHDQAGTPAYQTAMTKYRDEKALSASGRYTKFVPDMPPGYTARGGKVYSPDGKEVTSPSALKRISMDWLGIKKQLATVNGPAFQRLTRNGAILLEGARDPQTGKHTESELDKIIRLRNAVPDGAFGQFANNVRAFNSWDQFVAYQTSDPRVTALKSSVIANAERLGSMYAGGGTVTSDKKLQLAQDLLDYKLGRPGFKSLVDMHKDSIRSTTLKFSEINPEGNLDNNFWQEPPKASDVGGSKNISAQSSNDPIAALRQLAEGVGDEADKARKYLQSKGL
jgi:hypothetical protein